jgi:hypothetical protein
MYLSYVAANIGMATLMMNGKGYGKETVVVLLSLPSHWQEQDMNVRSQDLNQLAASQLELPREGSGTG